MDNNTIIGYNILAKRAIETESGINIDEALRRITAYRFEGGEGEDYHPAADVTISTKIIYYTKTDKGYLGWIWVDGEGWVCAGGVSDSWKAWSEDHGSNATGEHSVYIGEDNISEAAFPNYQLGHDNLIDGEVLDTILDAKEDVSLNLGSKNIIHGEGINLGKKNTTDTFGITIGQRNVSHGAGIAIGEDLTVDNGSFGIGKQMRLESGSYAIGTNYDNFRVGYGSHLFGSNNSGGLDNGSYLFGGCNTLQSTYGSIIVGQFNTLTNSSAALTMIGLSNRAGDGDGPYNTVAIGNYNDIKGSSAVALGIGAGSKNCSIAISGKGTNSQLGSFADSGSIAIGNRGVYAYDGSTSIGTDGVAAHYHGISIGHGGVHTYNYSFAFGKSVCSHNYSMSLGMDGCYSWEQSIAVGRSGAVALDRSMVFGRDGVFAWQRGIAIGEAGVQAISNAVALGLENVKGSTSSVSIGRAGVYTYNASVAFGNGGYAVDGSMSLLNVPNQTSFSYKYDGTYDYIQNYALFWFSGKDGREGYVDVKLTGISKNSNGYVVNGSTYSRLKDVPFRDLTVYIRGYVDGQGNIIPYYTSKDMLDPPSSEDSWVLVNWNNGGRNDDTINVRSSFSETEIGFGASGGSLVVGNTAACATNGSVAISLRNQGGEPSFSLGLVTLSNNTITISPRSGVSDYSTGQFAPISFAEASSSRNSLAIGTGSKADNGSTAIGVNSFADRGSMAVGYGLWSTINGFGKAIDDSLIISTVGYPSSGVRTRGESICNSIAIGSGPYSSNSSQSIGVCTKAESKSVSIGYYSRSSNESIAIGDDNETGLNAFAIGTKNLSYGWSMLFGVDNKTPRERGAHATLIGYNNTSTSNLEKLEKAIRVKYDKQTAIEKEVARFDKVHAEELNLIQPYLTTAEYDKVVSYEQALLDYYAYDAPEPEYDQQYWDIKNSLITFPDIQMTLDEWDTWYEGYDYGQHSMEYACEYYNYYTDYHEQEYWDEFVYYRDYAYQYMPSFIQLMIEHADTESHRISLQNALALIADSPEEFNREIIKTFYYWSSYRDTLSTYNNSYDSRSYSRIGKLPAEIQPTYKEADAEANSLLIVMQNIKRSGSSGVYIDEVEEVPCNNILLGSGNTSNHYNSVLIGANNESLAPPEEKSKTDDDGFTLAIGYHNKVERNYDIAIGYMSEARGGENVAIQHSVAGNGNSSYHNLAMFDSKALGTGNMAFQNASINAGFRNLAMFDSTIDGYGVLNIAHGNSIITAASANRPIANFVMADSNTTSHGDFQYNRVFNSVVDTYADTFNNTIDASLIRMTGTVSNNIFSKCGGYDKRPFSVNGCINQNIFFGIPKGGEITAITDRNVIFCIPTIGIHASTASDNIISGENGISVSAGSLIGNIFIDSDVNCQGSTIRSNVALGKSVMVGNGGDSTTYNFLFNAYYDISNAPEGSSSRNVLFNCNAQSAQDSFCFGFGNSANLEDDQYLRHSHRTVAFGDGKIIDSYDLFHFGSDNILTGLVDSLVFGGSNELDGGTGLANPIMTSIRMMGSNNILQGNVDDLIMLGNANNIHGSRVWCNRVIGSSNVIHGSYNISGNSIIGSKNIVTGLADEVVILDNASELSSITSLKSIKVINTSTYPNGTSLTYIYQGDYYFYSNNTLTMAYGSDMKPEDKVNAVSISGSTLYNNYNYGTLVEGTWYYATSTIRSISVPAGVILYNDQIYSFDGTELNISHEVDESARHVFNNAIIGGNNTIFNNVAGYSILGGINRVRYTTPRNDTDSISYGIIQGNNNDVRDGSNIICMGNGNKSTGHNSVAIGAQLISNQWQTVVGKYNSPIAGPNRLDTETPQDPDKALFIIGNGYSEKDDKDWQDESYITRSNAMVVYADGTVRAKKFVADEPELEIEAGTGIIIQKNLTNKKMTISADSVIPTAPQNDGTYVLQCIVSNGQPTYTWVNIGTTQV